MRVVMLTWEYPPRIVGGIARHVEELSWALAARGTDVHVVTCVFGDAPAEETYNGAHIHRVAPYEPTNDFVHWVHQLNAAMHDRAAGLIGEWLTGVQNPKLLLPLHSRLCRVFMMPTMRRWETGIPRISTTHW